MSPITQVSSEVFSRFVEWDSLGFFAIPGDSAQSYSERVGSLLKTATGEETEAVRSVVKTCYGVDPSWVDVVFSNEDLFPWEAGCTWYSCTWYSEIIDEAPLIQLRSAFCNKKTYLGLYDRDEILAH